MKSLQPIQIFLRVAETGSFTRAAESLGLRKGRVSVAIRELEHEIGARLLNRTTRAVELTEDGRVFYAEARELIGEFENLYSMFFSEGVSLKGRLRVDLPTELARAVIIPALPAFMEKHPDLELEISCTDRLVDLVRESFDCVLRIGSVSDDSLVSRKLGRLKMINAASPAYLAQFGEPKSLEDLTRLGHRMVHYTSKFGSKPYGWEYPSGDGYKTLQLKGRLHVNCVQAYHAAGLSGAGLMQFPAYGADIYIKNGDLVEILPDFRAEPLDVSLVVAHRTNMSRRVRTFMDWLSELLKPFLI